MRIHYLLLPLPLLLFSCAQMQIPGGGARDTTAPRVLKYLPDSAAVNFKGNTIRILFDENIQLKDITGNLVISPPLQKPPEVKLIKNRTVELVFKETLKPNTTYSVYFGNTIADVHEGNAAEGFTYTFSTGPVIDSISLFGSVSDALSGSSMKNVTIMLYSETDDSLPYKRIPDYFSRCKADGSYAIRNIRPGKYKAFALQDINRNFLFDSEEESIGFPDSLLDLTKNTKRNFKMFTEEKRKQFVKRSSLVEPGKILIVLNKPAPDLKIAFGNGQQPHSTTWMNVRKDSAYLFFSDYSQDSLVLKLSSLESVWKEDVAIRTTKQGTRILKPKVVYSGGSMQDINEPVRILFNYPIDTFSFFGTLPDKNDLSAQDSTALEFSVDRMEVEVRPAVKKGVPLWEDGTAHQIILNPGCFTAFGELLSDSIKLEFKTHETKFYGNLELKVQLKKGTYILQLMNDKGRVIHQENIKGDHTLTLPILLPGSYRARVIADENNNGKWDSGNYLKRLQPEKVIYSPGSFSVRSDWDVQEVWKVE